MAEVTRLNFDEMMPLIEKAIELCSFIAIDIEFTGLDLGSAGIDRIKLIDTLPERYQKLKIRATNMIPCQIGLSMFTNCPNDNSYSVEAYIFYVCPRKIGSVDKTFMCQLKFLSSYNFDFNKFLHDGIPYINKKDQEKVLKELKDGTLYASHERLLDTETIRNIDSEINKLLEIPKKCNKKNEIDSQKFVITLPIDKACHVFFQLNAIRRKYPSVWAYTKDNLIIVEKVSQAEKKKLTSAYEDDIKTLRDFLGFTRVFKLLYTSCKPIVGHNFLLDLMLLYHHFYDDLPDSYVSFKEELDLLFPFVFDTKHIWLNMRKVKKLPNTPKHLALQDLYIAFESPVGEMATLYQPSIKPSNCEKYLYNKFPHESGYDSFMTGCVFIKISHLLAMERYETPCMKPHMKSQSFKEHLKAISPFANKIMVAYSKIEYLNLNGEDPEPLVPNDLYISHKTNRSLTDVELSKLLENYSLVEWKLVHRKRGAVIIIGNVKSYFDILKRFKDDPDYIVSVYNSKRILSVAFWVTAAVSSYFLAVLIYKKILKP
ncbi:poly(A)-specific ribonuclease PNLDC1 [Nephila pilipes]|uniref:Poly(A)-specific ribonuclease PNLDC1 n=1 Tax=Nephila pilipes TaxID=299642 RepID=A0A8X6NH55_NEPPI|nr:poly(A)-specific ribonuclease PNLDC1 [Nephila pilipes]